MSKWVLKEARAISVELVLDWLQNFRLLCDCPFNDLVAIRHVYVQTHRGTAHGSGASVALAHAGIFVRQHDARITDLQLCVTNLAVRTIHPHDYSRAEDILVILNRFRSTLDDQGRSDRIVSLRNVVDFAHN